jgi:hypothetical protein
VKQLDGNELSSHAISAHAQLTTPHMLINMWREVPTLKCTDMHKNFIFEQGGAPPFPGRWFGREGPTAWPPTSPDLTPLAFVHGDY